GRYHVPTVALELRLITELYRNRPDRYGPLIAHLRSRGCDLDFIRRGIAMGQLPEALRQDVLDQLKGAPAQAVAYQGHGHPKTS
ncbi:MAG: hypothetical protein JXC32_14440, partial [Anaerolineae bacterium]|nr:hypothetical protein [Anaerolineae bacterium]